MGGEVVHDQCARRRLRKQCLVEAIRAKGLQPGGEQVLLTHRGPDIGVERGRVAYRLVWVAALRNAAAAGQRARSCERRLWQPVPVWRHAREVHSGQHRGVCERSRHVVPLAEVGQAHARERAEALTQRQQVGQRLARVLVIGQRVHNRHRRPAGEFIDGLVRERSCRDAIDHPREHAGHVLDWLAAAELYLGVAEIDCAPAEA